MSQARRLLGFALAPLMALAIVPACTSDEGAKTDEGAERPECFPGPHEKEPEAELHSPRWAFEPWLSKDYSSAEDTLGFVKASLEHDIPVGAVVLDSPWESNYNTFEFDSNPGRYPNGKEFIDELSEKGVKVVVWVTQFINSASFDVEKQAKTRYESPSPGYELAASCGFFVNGGDEYAWWKGRGASIDFFNESAVAFWHSLQDKVLDLGVAGFKLDFGESYVRTKTIETAQGPVTHQEYSEEYYANFYRHGVKRRGRDFVTMVRGWDESYDFAGRFFARPEHAPVVWAGDNTRDWAGLVDALDHTFRSANAGYVVVGSDIGGYLDRHDKNLLGPEIPFDSMVFAKWTAMSALMPFMQLHGRDDLMPWSVPEDAEETLAMYRYWAQLHHALVPFFYSLSEETYAKRADGIVIPLSKEPSDWDGDFRYLLGDAFLVAPILDETGVRDVELPGGARYYDWWTPEADAIEGGTTITDYDARARERIPFFIREGAIVPLNLDSDAVFSEGSLAKGKLTVLAWPGEEKTSFVLHDEDDERTVIEAQAHADGGTVSLDRVIRPTLLRIRTGAEPGMVEVDGKEVGNATSFAALAKAESGYWYDATSRSTWVSVAASSGPLTIKLGSL